MVGVGGHFANYSTCSLSLSNRLRERGSYRLLGSKAGKESRLIGGLLRTHRWWYMQALHILTIAHGGPRYGLESRGGEYEFICPKH